MSSATDDTWKTAEAITAHMTRVFILKLLNCWDEGKGGTNHGLGEPGPPQTT